jgi:hypothetical protein
VRVDAEHDEGIITTVYNGWHALAKHADFRRPCRMATHGDRLSDGEVIDSCDFVTINPSFFRRAPPVTFDQQLQEEYDTERTAETVSILKG